MRQLLVPDRCRMQDLPAGLETWEELVRRCERSRAIGGGTTSRQAVVPSESEQHLAMNRARLTTCDQDRGEIHVEEGCSDAVSIALHAGGVFYFGIGRLVLICSLQPQYCWVSLDLHRFVVSCRFLSHPPIFTLHFSPHTTPPPSSPSP